MRESAASHSETAILPSGPGAKFSWRRRSEAGSFQPQRHRFGSKAEPAMGVLVAQEFEIVRREIDDQQPAAWAEHPCRLADGARAVVEKVQHLMNNDGIERIARQREVINVGVTDAAIFQAGAVEPGAGERQHVEREVEPEAALDIGAKQFEHPAGAGAEVKQRTDRLRAECAADRLLDGDVSDVQLADAIPFGGVTTKIILRRGGAGGADGGEPFAIAGDHRIVRVDACNQVAGDVGGAAALTQPKECPRSLAVALHQSGLGQKPQVARQAGLRLAQNGGEIGNGQLGLGNQHQKPQPRGFRGGLEDDVQIGKRQFAGFHPGGPCRCSTRYKDIFMRLKVRLSMGGVPRATKFARVPAGTGAVARRHARTAA